jgi:chromosome partitioning protein
MPVTIATANHKGGTGKTTTVHCLGVHFAEGGYRVLMVDVDPQSSLTSSCGVSDAAGGSMAEVLGGVRTLAEVIIPVADCLDLAPADIALTTVRCGKLALKETLAEVAGRYDLILIDCPPSLGLMTINALATSDGVLCPTQPAAQDLRGLLLFLSTLVHMRKEINPKLVVIGIVPTFFDERTIHHRGVLQKLQNMKMRILQPIGRSIRVAEAPAVGESVLTFAPDNPQAFAYRRLGEQVEQWIESERNKR